MSSAAKGHDKIVKVLLASKADTGAKDNAGNTAAALARMSKHDACVELLKSLPGGQRRLMVGGKTLKMGVPLTKKARQCCPTPSRLPHARAFLCGTFPFALVHLRRGSPCRARALAHATAVTPPPCPPHICSSLLTLCKLEHFSPLSPRVHEPASTSRLKAMTTRSQTTVKLEPWTPVIVMVLSEKLLETR